MGEPRPLSALLDKALDLPPPPPQIQERGRTTQTEVKRVHGVAERRWERCTFATYDLPAAPEMAPAFERCRLVAHGHVPSAFLAGTTGNGKTHLAIAAMHEFIENGGSAYFWKVPDFLEWIKAVAYGQDKGVLTTLHSYVHGDFLLVLDDLGVQKNTDWVDEQLYRVLDARYEAELPTIVTSNVMPDDIEERLRSRLAPGLVVCPGADWRRKKES